MREIKFIIFVFLTILFNLLLQILFAEYLPVFGMPPQFLLVSVIFMSMRYGPLFGELFGFVSGLFLDTFSISVFGANSLIFTLVGYIYGSFSGKLNEDKAGVQVFLTAIASYCHIVFLMFTALIFTAKAGIGTMTMVIGPLYTVIVSPVLFGCLRFWVNKIEKWSGKTNQR